ncbi:hypothetical protein Q31b_03940 [Novipirellula aureliae]|uniref:Uncharacterized protein n=1 Tax=Novipirellula aureliae TaxID=2527966 RepID=A0A5C6E6E1_9BACT|nr:hypothetical protein [Novipirellula aureliae]TWU45223.1 hypothetical protein Q31b_03940 [Novipirellula aureliae]
MKIKCPGCAAVLNIPETAAGKIVQCSCGKKLRAPGRPAAGSPAAGRPAAGGQSSPRPQAKRPAAAHPQQPAARPQPPAAASNFGGLDAGLFDELNEKDLQGVTPVHRPSSAVASAPSAGGKLMQQYGPTASEHDQSAGARPGLLIAVGVINVLYSGLFFLIALFFTLIWLGIFFSEADIREHLDPEMENFSTVLTVIVFLFWAVWVWTIAVCASCFIRNKVCWYVLLLSYSFTVIYYLFSLADDLLTDLNIAEIIITIASICISSLTWVYLHQQRPREFYGTTTVKTPIVIATNVAGGVLGIIIGLLILL